MFLRIVHGDSTVLAGSFQQEVRKIKKNRKDEAGDVRANQSTTKAYETRKLLIRRICAHEKLP